MPAEPISSSGLRPILSITAMRHEAGGDRDDARDDVALERRFLGEAGQLPQRLAVVEDDVDADELLEDRQHDPGPDDRANAEQAVAP